MFYRIAATIAVVLVCLFAASRHTDNDTAPVQSAPAEESGLKGLQTH